jgi:hypothetical protein
VALLKTDEQRKLTYRMFFPEDHEKQTLSVPTISLEDLCYISVGMVIHADEKQVQGAFQTEDLISGIKDEKHPKAFAEGKNLSKWIMSGHRYLEWGTKRAPAQFRRKTFPELYEHKSKLMLPMVGEIRAALDVNRLCCNHGIFVCVHWHFLSGVRNPSIKKAARYRSERPLRPDLPYREELEKNSRRFDEKFLLGVLNSQMAKAYLRANRRNNVQLYPEDWKKLPIPDVGAKEQGPIVKLVDQILVAKKKSPDADTSVLEKEIDNLVYKLFGLVQEEIAIEGGKALLQSNGAIALVRK